MNLAIHSFEMQQKLIELNSEVLWLVNQVMNEGEDDGREKQKVMDQISRCIIRIGEGICDLKHVNDEGRDRVSDILAVIEDYCHALNEIVHGEMFVEGVKPAFLTALEKLMNEVERIEDGML